MPLVAVFDDIQWAEDVLLDLLEHVAFLSTGAPILLLCMARPELLDRRSGWGGVLRLQPLSAEEAERLIDAKVDGHELEAEMRERILRAAGGNPLFVEEMAAMVQSSGDESRGAADAPGAARGAPRPARRRRSGPCSSAAPSKARCSTTASSRRSRPTSRGSRPS